MRKVHQPKQDTTTNHWMRPTLKTEMVEVRGACATFQLLVGLMYLRLRSRFVFVLFLRSIYLSDVPVLFT